MLIASGGLKEPVAQLQGGDYPLVNPSADIEGLLADAYLSHEVRDAVPPLRIARLCGFDRSSVSGTLGSVGGDNPYQVLILDARDAVVFDSERGTYHGRPFSDAYYVHEWVADKAVCRLVERLRAEETGVHHTWPDFLEPESAVLDSNTTEKIPERVEGLSAVSVAVGGRVELLAGYNIQMVVGDDAPLTGQAPSAGIKRRTIIRFDAVPGVGLGRRESCQDSGDNAVRSIGGVGVEESGNFVLSAEGCLYVRVPSSPTGTGTASFEPNMLKVGNDCIEPCCSCDDYRAVQAGIVRQRDYYVSLGATAESVRDQFRQMKARWMAQRDCRIANPLKMTLTTKSTSTYDHLTIMVALANITPRCVRLKVNVRVTALTGVGEFTPNGTFLLDSQTQTWQNGIAAGSPDNFYVEWLNIDPGYAGKAIIGIRWTHDPTCLNEVSNVTANGYVADLRVGLSVSKQILFPCDPESGMKVK